MPKNLINKAGPPPGCETCARELNAILAGHTLHVGFRPMADFARCEIFGFIASIRSPAGMLHSAADHLARISRHLGLLREFCRETVDAAVLNFLENGNTGLLFLATPKGAIDTVGRVFAEDILAAVNRRDCPTERVVLLVPGVATSGFDEAVATAGYLRSLGFQLAMRNFGCDLEEQRLWSQVPPDYVVLEEYLFDGIDLATVHNSGLSARIVSEAVKGRRIVADGIRSSSDLVALHQIGIQYGAGDFIGRASSAPTRAMSAAAHKALMSVCECGDGARRAPDSVLERLLIEVAPVASTSTSDEVFSMFEHAPELRAVAVVDGDAPRGLISRYEMIGNMARPYRHELYGRKPCTRFMDPQPLVVDFGVSLQELSQIVVSADPRHLISGFIISDHGRYLGMGSVQDLVREVTAMQMEAATYANPLTQLPGNVPINQYIDNLLATGEACVIAYCDLDHFKPFNDVYGYAKGDEVIKLTARVLTAAIDAERDFLGHIGGDDFVIIMRSDDWEVRCKSALALFGDDILAFFSNDDIERGGYITENRKGNMEFHRLTSLSIGTVEATPSAFQNHLQVSKVAAEVKKRAKAIAGNSLYINRRLYHNGTLSIMDEPAHPEA
jgi:GGDEF domain-containing protein/EAL domain-containing protein (putative c-di-GMP-specific phosphodiesterase class I)